MTSKVTIELVDNGYILHNSTGFSGMQVYKTLDEVFERLLQIYEGRTIHFSGESYGKVLIERNKK